MEFILKRFDELTNVELYKILELRSEVFVVEQNCVYQDIDNQDIDSYHLFVMDNDKCIACLRIIKNSESNCHLGRIVVKENMRKKNLGYDLVKKGIDISFNKLNFNHIDIEAQAYAIGFYQKCGFKNIGNQHLLDGIPHVDMTMDKNL